MFRISLLESLKILKNATTFHNRLSGVHSNSHKFTPFQPIKRLQTVVLPQRIS